MSSGGPRAIVLHGQPAFPCLAPDLCPAPRWGKVQAVPEPEPRRDFPPTAWDRAGLGIPLAVLVLVPLPAVQPKAQLCPSLAKEELGVQL